MRGVGRQRYRRRRDCRPQFRYTDREAIPDWIECAIVLGGDGTLIQAARDLAGSNIPLLGVNMGTLGYLAQIGREEDILPALDELIARSLRTGAEDYAKGNCDFRREGCSGRHCFK